jgi:hypothetical protein
MNIDKKLDEILDKFLYDLTTKKPKVVKELSASIKQLFQELIEEVIGDDDKEDFSTIDSDYDYSTRNTLKAEQRQRAKEILNRK